MYFKFIVNTLALLCVPLLSLAMNTHVYTIGAYDDAFAQHAAVLKLGPLPANDVPSVLPVTFLEEDGSYGGGEAFQSIEQACELLKSQLEAGTLPATEAWHIYLLDADWFQDTYQLHPHDFRISHSVKVVKMVQDRC